MRKRGLSALPLNCLRPHHAQVLLRPRWGQGGVYLRETRVSGQACDPAFQRAILLQGPRRVTPPPPSPPHPQALSRHCCLHPAWNMSIHASIPRSIHAFTHRLIHGLIHSSSHAFVHRPIDAFIHSPIHTFVQPPAPPLLSAQVGQTPAKPGGSCDVVTGPPVPACAAVSTGQKPRTQTSASEVNSIH